MNSPTLFISLLFSRPLKFENSQGHYITKFRFRAISRESIVFCSTFRLFSRFIILFTLKISFIYLYSILNSNIPLNLSTSQLSCVPNHGISSLLRATFLRKRKKAFAKRIREMLFFATKLPKINNRNRSGCELYKYLRNSIIITFNQSLDLFYGFTLYRLRFILNIQIVFSISKILWT